MGVIEKLQGFGEKIVKVVSTTIRTFVSFQILIFSLGLIIGYIFARLYLNPLYLALVPLLGVVAYYNNTVAWILFIVVAFILLI